MPRELILMRHAKSSWRDPDLDDADRPLKGRGRQNAIEMGEWLHEQGWCPDLVYASPAKRARQTAHRACDALNYDREDILWHRRLYFDGIEAHLRLIRRTDQAVKRLMLIGHNPDLDDLVLHLADRDISAEADGKLMVTAAVAWFILPGDWVDVNEGSLDLKILHRPKWLN